MPSLSTKRATSHLTVVVAVCVLLVAMSAVVFVGCGGEASLVGVWTNPEMGTLDFKSDGTLVADIFEGLTPVYTAEDGKLSISSGETVLVTLDYALDGDTLSLTDLESGQPIVFTRQ